MQKLSSSTINEHCSNVKRFTDWLKLESALDTANVRYNDLLAYIQHEKQKHISPATINLRLASISWYFEFLKKEGEVQKNVAKTLRVKGVIRRVVENPLNADELQELYQQYSQLGIDANDQLQDRTRNAHQRNTVIVGLLINQGIHSGELQKMEINHINLKEGTVYIPSTAKSNSRILQLVPAQILPIHEYLQVTRPLLKPQGDELFPGSMRNIILQLVEELQGINPVIANALHIRGSVIIGWLKRHNKRQVQYMAGHKYISSTEAYAMQELDTLQDELSKHHPFG